MADVLDQIQQGQAQAQLQQIAATKKDLDWSTTFGKMPPDAVLRETRNMAALIANAVEGKQKLLAQTSAEAQRIYITNKKFEAEQNMQPLKDDRLKVQIRVDEARERATLAQERLAASRLERDATAVEHTASAQWEMDQLENAKVPDDEKRAWLNTVRGKYPGMDKDATARHEALHSVLNPRTDKIEAEAAARARGSAVAQKTPVQIEEEAAARARGTASVKPEKDPVLPSLEKERTLHVRMLDRAKRIRAKAADDDIKKDADADIQESERSLAEIESQIRTVRGGGQQPPATPPTLTAAAGAAPDPRLTLAQKALADPNAPEAVKTRAKQLLGIP